MAFVTRSMPRDQVIARHNFGYEEDPKQQHVDCHKSADHGRSEQVHCDQVAAQVFAHRLRIQGGQQREKRRHRQEQGADAVYAKVIQAVTLDELHVGGAGHQCRDQPDRDGQFSNRPHGGQGVGPTD